MTSELLSGAIERALQPKKGKEHLGVILMLDESDQILEHAMDPHFDTGNSSRVLCSLFNNSYNSSKQYTLSTVNDCETFSEPIKDRILINGIIFKTLGKDEDRLDAFLEQLEIQGFKRHSDCDDDFLLKQFSKLEGWTNRSFEGLVTQASYYSQKDGGDLNNLVLAKDHVKKAIEYEKGLRTVIKRGQKVKTEREEREEQHRESIKAHLIEQTCLNPQTTVGASGGVNVGIEGLGGNLGGAISTTNAPGLSKENAQKVWDATFPDSGEKLFFEENKKSDANFSIKFNGSLVIVGNDDGYQSWIYNTQMKEWELCEGPHGKVKWRFNEITKIWEPVGDPFSDIIFAKEKLMGSSKEKAKEERVFNIKLFCNSQAISLILGDETGYKRYIYNPETDAFVEAKGTNSVTQWQFNKTTKSWLPVDDFCTII